MICENGWRDEIEALVAESISGRELQYSKVAAGFADVEECLLCLRIRIAGEDHLTSPIRNAKLSTCQQFRGGSQLQHRVYQRMQYALDRR